MIKILNAPAENYADLIHHILFMFCIKIGDTRPKVCSTLQVKTLFVLESTLVVASGYSLLFLLPSRHYLHATQSHPDGNFSPLALFFAAAQRSLNLAQ
jgi:hypothetical protein